MVAGRVSDVVDLYQTTSTKKRKADMKALKEQIQVKLAEKKLKREQTIPSRPPRYKELSGWTVWRGSRFNRRIRYENQGRNSQHSPRAQA